MYIPLKSLMEWKDMTVCYKSNRIQKRVLGFFFNEGTLTLKKREDKKSMEKRRKNIQERLQNKVF